MADDNVTRIFALLDDILQRTTKVETILEESKKYHDDFEKDLLDIRKSVMVQGERIGRLEQAKAGAVAIREFVAWGVATIAALWALTKP